MEWSVWLCLAYFIHDTVHMLMSWKYAKRTSMLFHHILYILISVAGLLTYSNEVTYIMYTPVLIFSLEESSTIFLNFRWFVIKVFCNGKPSSKFVKMLLAVNFYLFTFFFVFFRCIHHPSSIVPVPCFPRFLKHLTFCISCSPLPARSNSFILRLSLSFSYPFRLFLHGIICGVLLWRKSDLDGVVTGIYFIVCVLLTYALNLYWAYESISSSVNIMRKKKAKPL